MSNEKYAECECSGWCRVDLTPEQFKAKHHPDCEHYNDTLRVVKITHMGQTLIDSDIAGALAALADGDDYAYEIEICQMLQREYESLAEFDGF